MSHLKNIILAPKEWLPRAAVLQLLTHPHFSWASAINDRWGRYLPQHVSDLSWSDLLLHHILHLLYSTRKGSLPHTVQRYQTHWAVRTALSGPPPQFPMYPSRETTHEYVNLFYTHCSAIWLSHLTTYPGGHSILAHTQQLQAFERLHTVSCRGTFRSLQQPNYEKWLSEHFARTE